MKVLTILSALVFALSLHSSQSMAQDSGPEEVTPENSYTMFCGSLEELKTMAKAKGEKITAKDLEELNSSRADILTVLAQGKSAIERILAEGSKSDTGSFGAILTCGMIVEMKSDIVAKGCVDLKTNKSVKDNGGIAACESMMNSLNRRNK